ncbi:MAG: hypothetical protein HC825_10055 [Oscillatoriales cyanobacterium RM1_1_9]|nr:hypothetical protein [Oscillatoriales cyanobacterium SM2_3_0]NJO46904.1 hypothetical protein [Oscillatoriales cyanobacterium RM2_1_1]NJO71917.1 hypothetical protein [Oscillatoriales cyanobacterium RM1_1_9]
MQSNAGFVFKVLAVSAGLSVAIKVIGPDLSLDATSLNALIAVILPVALVAAALGWRGMKSEPSGHVQGKSKIP